MAADLETCENGRDNPAAQVAACTNIIEAGQVENMAGAYFLRGHAFYRQGQFDSAISDVTRYLAFFPDSAAAYVNRGAAYNEKGENDLALADYDAAIRLDPTNAFAFINRANVWSEEGEPEKAIADFTEAIRLDPKDPKPYRLRARIWENEGAFARAIEGYNQALRVDPGYVDALNSLSWLLATGPREIRNGVEAVRLGEKAVALANEGYIHVTLAAAYAEAGDPMAALREYETAIRLDNAYTSRYQQDLKTRGYYAGAVDGFHGPGTRSAIEACVRAGCQLLTD
ncbi:MAG: tetratricopeptide repeat protein [Proteobacteria bacterium]|nr:tetratricopeptide repeat protein [Pseudomonadota bacterium]